MKHLQMSAATILSLLAIAVLVCLFAVMPTTASAGGIEYTIGNGSLEGDPGDGLEFSGGCGDLQSLSGDAAEANFPAETEIQFLFDLGGIDIIIISLPSWIELTKSQLATCLVPLWEVPR